MNHELKLWTRHLNRDELSAQGKDIINIIQGARDNPGNFIYLTREAARKTNDKMHLQCCIINKRGANVLHIRWQAR